ncbi:hypothetical protein D3C86_1058130 [compost metagenome]
MNNIKFLISSFLLLFVSCNTKTESVKTEKLIGEKTNFEILTEEVSTENLPKEINFDGKLKEITKLKDLNGEHIIVLTETGEIPSKKIIQQEDETDFRIFAYDYSFDKNENKYKLNWEIQDFISNCEFDLMMGFLKNTFKITDLNKNGIAEIWTMYSMTCTSDVSPSKIKIIMYEGKQKFALRGNSIVNPGTEKIGGDYKLDENLSKAPKEIKEFALKMWKENNEQKYE